MDQLKNEKFTYAYANSYEQTSKNSPHRQHHIFTTLLCDVLRGIQTVVGFSQGWSLRQTITRDPQLQSSTLGMSRSQTRSQLSAKEASIAVMADLENLKINPETLEADFLEMIPPPPLPPTERPAMRRLQRYPVVVHTRTLGPAIAPPQNLDSRIAKMRAIMRNYTLSAKERSRRVRNLTMLAEQDFIEAVSASKSEEEDVAIDPKHVNGRANGVSLIRHDSCIHSRSFSRLPTITEEKAEEGRAVKASVPKKTSGDNLHIKHSNPSSPKPKSRIPVRRYPARGFVPDAKEVRSRQDAGFSSIEARLATLDAFFDEEL
ncbi:hypothetical protein BST61_g3972 [Cercospora zeina]